MTVNQPPIEALRAGEYVKSRSSSEGQECVMLSATVDGWIGVQDSKEYPTTPTSARSTLGFPRRQFAEFLEGLRTDQSGQLG